MTSKESIFGELRFGGKLPKCGSFWLINIKFGRFLVGKAGKGQKSDKRRDIIKKRTCELTIRYEFYKGRSRDEIRL